MCASGSPARSLGRRSALAPAKINLALHVTGQREDGYHLIETLCVFADFGDRISVESAAGDSFGITGPFAGATASDDANLVAKARDLLRNRFGRREVGPVAIALKKNVPVAAGLGGGSSNAAAALKLLSGLPNRDGTTNGLAELGLSIGADVPMCLIARPLVAHGIGESIENMDNFPRLHVLLVNPGVHVLTGDIFSSLTGKDNPALPPLPSARSTEAIIAWLKTTRNDLQVPAVANYPEIAEAIDILSQSGAGFARMSGSGATCFGIFADASAANSAKSAIAKAKPGWFVKATTTGGSATGTEQGAN